MQGKRQNTTAMPEMMHSVVHPKEEFVDYNLDSMIDLFNNIKDENEGFLDEVDKSCRFVGILMNSIQVSADYKTAADRRRRPAARNSSGGGRDPWRKGSAPPGMATSLEGPGEAGREGGRRVLNLSRRGPCCEGGGVGTDGAGGDVGDEGQCEDGGRVLPSPGRVRSPSGGLLPRPLECGAFQEAADAYTDDEDDYLSCEDVPEDEPPAVLPPSSSAGGQSAQGGQQG